MSDWNLQAAHFIGSVRLGVSMYHTCVYSNLHNVQLNTYSFAYIVYTYM